MTLPPFDLPSIESPRVSIAEIQHLAADQLSLRSRIGHTLVLVVSLTMAVGVGSLWVTEPSLPLRAHVAFAMIVSMALTWSGFATWILFRRRVLLGTDRVIAARIGVAFSGLATVAMLALGYWGGAGRPAYLAGLINGGLFLCAMVLLVRAQRRLAALVLRRRELEQHLKSERVR